MHVSVGHGHVVSTFNPLVQDLGEVAAEEATLWNTLKFTLMPWPLWSIWTDMRPCLNVVCPLEPSASTPNFPQSGTDDTMPRVYILTPVLLIDYTAQNASIRLCQDALTRSRRFSRGDRILVGCQRHPSPPSSYGTRGISQRSGALSSFKLSSLSLTPSSSFAWSISTFFLPPWKYPSWRWDLTSL